MPLRLCACVSYRGMHVTVVGRETDDVVGCSRVRSVQDMVMSAYFRRNHRDPLLRWG
jgi:hypothetical protein